MLYWQCTRCLTLWALNGVDGLLPTRFLMRSSREAVVLIQMQLEPHSKGIQYALLGYLQGQSAYLSGAQTLQLLRELKE